MNDPRVEAVLTAQWEGRIEEPEEGHRGFGRGTVRDILSAADAADREQGIHRVRVDDATVQQLDTILRRPRTNDELLHEYHERRMSEVIAALTGAES